MFLVLLICLLCTPLRFFCIFDNFDFTDLEDFMPLCTVIIGLICAFFICHAAPRKASAPLVGSMCLLSLWPALPHIGLLALALEFQAVNHQWPQVMADDPKGWYGHINPLFDTLFNFVSYLEAFSGAWMVIFLILILGAGPRFSVRQRRVFTGILVLSILMMVLDSGGVEAWWMD